MACFLTALRGLHGSSILASASETLLLLLLLLLLNSKDAETGSDLQNEWHAKDWENSAINDSRSNSIGKQWGHRATRRGPAGRETNKSQVWQTCRKVIRENRKDKLVEERGSRPEPSDDRLLLVGQRAGVCFLFISAAVKHCKALGHHRLYSRHKIDRYLLIYCTNQYL